MISIQHEPTVIVMDCELTVVVRIGVTSHARGDKWLFTGDKRPMAVICRTTDGEQIFGMDGRLIDAAGLKELATADDAQSAVGFRFK